MMPTLLLLACLTIARHDLAVANDQIRRAFEFEAGRGAVTTRYSAGGRDLPVESLEFRIVLSDGRALTPSDLPDASFAALPAELGTHGVLIRYRAIGSPFEVAVAHLATPGSPALFKQVQLSAGDASGAANGAELRIETLDIETLTLRHETLKGGGSGAVSTSAGGWRFAIEHPAAECRVDGATVVLREHAGSRATAIGDRHVWPWSQRARVGIGEAVATDALRCEPAHSIELVWFATASETWRDSLAPTVTKVRDHFDSDARLHFITPVDLLAGAGWFEVPSTLPTGVVGRVLRELRQPSTAVALTVPLGDPTGLPRPISSADELRAAKRALVAALQCDGKLEPPHWFLHQMPSTLPTEPGAAARLFDGWIALFATERKLCPDAKLALFAPADGEAALPLSPFWSRFVDQVGAPIGTLPALTPRTGADRAAAAQALALREGFAAPLVTLPAGDGTQHDELLRWSRAALAFWNAAPTGDDVPRAFTNQTWRPRTFELPPRAGGWLRIAPWCEWVGGDERTSARGDLGAHEHALFVPLAASGAIGVIPGAGRFEVVDGERPYALLLAPGATQAFYWRDVGDGGTRGEARIGLAPAFQRRDATAPFAATLGPLTVRGDGVEIEITLTTPIFRQEEGELIVALEPPATVPASPTPPTTLSNCQLALLKCEPAGAAQAPAVQPTTTAARGIEWRVALHEGRVPARFALTLAGELPAGARLVIAARLHEQLERAPLAPPIRSRGPQRRPATPFAARRTTTLLLHDGALPSAVETAAVEASPQGQ